jgi:hypothetical protein
VLAHRAATVLGAQARLFSARTIAFIARHTLVAKGLRVLDTHEAHLRFAAAIVTGTTAVQPLRVRLAHALSPFIPRDHFPPFYRY